MLDTGSPPEARASHQPPGAGRIAAGAPWLAFWLLCLAVMVAAPGWEAIAFYLLWLSFALRYGLRPQASGPTLWLLAAVTLSTAGAIGLDIERGLKPWLALAKVPLMAAIVAAMVWRAQRRPAADAERARVSEHDARLASAQRRFLQDASHELRTPITVALGHAELLARELAGRAQERDIGVVVGELQRLRKLGERLLLIAASENPDFLRPEPVPLEQFGREMLRRWRPTARRRWQLGPLDHVIVSADRDRLGLAVDALLENAVRHTRPDQLIRLSVAAAAGSATASLIVEDGGSGIPPGELTRIFDRFATGSAAAGRGTGLGLALALAIARGHGGDVQVRSAVGEGSRFEVLIPVLAPEPGGPPGSPGVPAARGRPGGQAAPAVRARGTGAARHDGRPA